MNLVEQGDGIYQNKHGSVVRVENGRAYFLRRSDRIADSDPGEWHRLTPTPTLSMKDNLWADGGWKADAPAVGARLLVETKRGLFAAHFGNLKEVFWYESGTLYFTSKIETGRCIQAVFLDPRPLPELEQQAPEEDVQRTAQESLLDDLEMFVAAHREPKKVRTP